MCEIKKLSDEELKPYYSEYLRRWKSRNKKKVKEHNKRYSLKNIKKEQGIPLKSEEIKVENSGIPLNNSDIILKKEEEAGFKSPF